MTARKCDPCPYRDGEACGRYGKPAAKVKACGFAGTNFNRKPFTRRGAEIMRKWRNNEKERT